MYAEADRLAQLDALQRSIDTQTRIEATSSDLKVALLSAGYADDVIARANDLSDQRAAELDRLQANADFHNALDAAIDELARAKSAEAGAIAALARDCGKDLHKDLRTMKDVFSAYKQTRDTVTVMLENQKDQLKLEKQKNRLASVLKGDAELTRLRQLEDRLLKDLKGVQNMTERSFERATSLVFDSVRRAGNAGIVSPALAGGIQRYLSDLLSGATEQQKQAYEREMEHRAEIERMKNRHRK